MIPFKNTAHFFLYEDRKQGKLRSRHPFACIAVGFEPSSPELPFRASIALCHPKDNFVRKIGATRALGLLHSSNEGKHAHAAWFTRAAIKKLGMVCTDLGAERQMIGRFVRWEEAKRTYEYILADVEGLRLKDKVKSKNDKLTESALAASEWFQSTRTKKEKVRAFMMGIENQTT
jgi:hypothetical protein